MDSTLGDVSAKKIKPSAEVEAAKEFLKLASDRGLSLTGPDGLLKQFTKNVLETALSEEMTEHLGHEKNRAEVGRESANVRNGSRPKTVLSAAAGPVEIEVPRDRDGTFDPVIVKKRQRRLTEVDEVVLSLSARGLTTGEISAHFAQIYGASVSKETISRITDKVVEEMLEWQNRPLDDGWEPPGLRRAVHRRHSPGTTSRSATGRSRTGRSPQPSASTWPATRTFSGSGPGPAVGSRRSSGSK